MDATASPMYKDVSHPNQQGSFRMPNDSDGNIISAMKYEAKPGDLFICSYPKCGCTWLQSLVWDILHDGEGMKGHLRDNIPFLDFDGSESVMKMSLSNGYKIIKTHFPFDWVPRNPSAKYLFIAREPKDVCVSLYYHIKGFKGYNWAEGRFDDFVEIFLDGEADACDYFEMLDKWLQLGSSDSIHIMLYENMILDQRKEIRKVAKFLSAQLEVKLMAENGLMLESIIENTAFKKMREQEESLFMTKRTTPFVRKGIVGDWKNHMTEDQAKRFDRKTAKLVKKYPMLKLWDINSD